MIVQRYITYNFWYALSIIMVTLEQLFLFFFILIIYLVKVSVFDSVVQGGDAVWEGLRIYDGKVFKLDEHLDRCNNYFCISILFSACDI